MRWLYRALASVSAVVCAGAGALWADYDTRYSLTVLGLPRGIRIGVAVLKGRVYFDIQEQSAAVSFYVYGKTEEFEAFDWEGFADGTDTTGADIAGFGRYCLRDSDGYFCYTAPLWAPMLAAAWIGARCVMRLQKSGRLAPGRCPACGYDLRATPGRCPECGAERPSPNPPTAG